MHREGPPQKYRCPHPHTFIIMNFHYSLKKNMNTGRGWGGLRRRGCKYGSLALWQPGIYGNIRSLQIHQ